jgi:hypothetical protein
MVTSESKTNTKKSGFDSDFTHGWEGGYRAIYETEDDQEIKE